MKCHHSLWLVLPLAMLSFGACSSATSPSTPTVMTDSTYTVEVTTHTYAQGQVHDDWRGKSWDPWTWFSTFTSR